MNTLRSSAEYPVWHPFTPLVGGHPELEVVSASAELLTLADGRQLVDAVSSWWVNLHGHGHPLIAAAIAEQAQELEQVIFAGFTHKPAVDLAFTLIAAIGPQFKHVFYSDNGSTAIEVSLKMALQFWHNQGSPKKTFIALDGAYHGDTFGAMSVAERNAFNAPFSNHLFEVALLPLEPCNDIYEPLNDADLVTINKLETLVASGEIAGFIYEPLVQGSAGMRFYKLALLEQLIGICKKAGVLTIADEVMTGFGRLNKLFASHFLHDQFTPDIICLSKGITGGFLPLGATLTQAHIQEAFRSTDLLKTFFHGHSYTANPLACRAAIASLGILKSTESINQRNWLSAQLADFANEISAAEQVANVRALGCIMALEWRSPDKTGYFNEARHHLYQWFISQGVLLRPLGNVVYVIPPYCISQASLDKVFDAIRRLLKQL